MNQLLAKKDQIVMSLVHYFVTVENYSPINVQGVKDEIWLENLESPYKIIRINSKYIHNSEQYEMDKYKMEHIIKQVKKKTLSFKVKALNICLDINDDIKINNNDNIDLIKARSLEDIKNNNIIKNNFPDIDKDLNNDTLSIDKIISVTNDINTHTEEENKKYEKVFNTDKLFVTKILIFICILVYLIPDLNIYLANNRDLVLSGKYYLLLTSAFAHASLIHLIVNMYSLYIIGEQVENYFGKIRFLIIYLLSALSGSLLSIVFNTGFSVGASGAIFGLLGSLLYFGYHYRLYLSSVLRNQIIPLIILNLGIGFMTPGIDNACHIGGLLGGYLATMIVGVPNKSTSNERINGLIVYILYVIFIIYLLMR